MTMSAIYTLYSYKVVVADLSKDTPNNTDTCIHVYEGEAKGEAEVIEKVNGIIFNPDYKIVTVKIENEGEEL